MAGTGYTVVRPIETRKALAAPGCRLPADWRYFSQFQVLYAEAQALIEGGEPKDDRNGKAGFSSPRTARH